MSSIDERVERIRNGQARKFDDPMPEAGNLELVDPSTLAGIEPPERQWLIKDWLPVGCVTSLYAPGGVGKSLIAQQAATAIATGSMFFNSSATQAPVLVVAGEDDNNELHRRQCAINRQMALTWPELTAMRWTGRAGDENLIAVSNGTEVAPTALYDAIRDQALEIGARFVVIDNIAQVFAGNENARHEVTQFVGLLTKLSIDINGAVLLIGHTGKGDSARQFSGSTAWDAAVRSRWLLERTEPEDDEDPEVCAGKRILSRAKANYAPTGDTIPLEWHDGCFKMPGRHLKNAVDRIIDVNRPLEFEQAFLAQLDAMRKQGRVVSDSPNARNFAPKAMAGKGECKGVRQSDLKAAMERLFEQSRIIAGVNVCRKDNRTWRTGIGRVEWSQVNSEADSPCTEVAPRSDILHRGSETSVQSKPCGTREKDGCTEVHEKNAPKCTELAKKSNEINAPRLHRGAPHTPPISKDIEGSTLGVVAPIENDQANGPEICTHCDSILTWPDNPGDMLEVGTFMCDHCQGAVL